MNQTLPERDISCPYCGSLMTILIDIQDDMQPMHYVEDCQVCCRPIDFNVIVDIDAHIELSVQRDDD
jgi:hypothetical protein